MYNSPITFWRFTVASKKLTSIPIYEQLNQILSELIRSEEFKVGDKFLAERQICERFDVSRATANKAITKLIARNLLELKKGVGTFVKEPDSKGEELNPYVSFTNKTLLAGKKPSTIVLDYKESDSSRLESSVLKKLSISSNEKIVVSTRVRYADGKALIVEKHYFRKKFYESMDRSDVEGSIFDMHLKKFNIKSIRTDETIRIQKVDKRTAELLEMKENDPSFFVSFTTNNSDRIPLYYAELVYRGVSFEFHNRIGPIQISIPK